MIILSVSFNKAILDILTAIVSTWFVDFHYRHNKSETEVTGHLNHGVYEIN